MRPLALLALALSAACAPGWNDPAPPSPDYPCGPAGVVCASSRSCCSQDEVCGGEPASVGCPAGACCFVGAAPFEARRPSHPQKPLP